MTEEEKLIKIKTTIKNIKKEKKEKEIYETLMQDWIQQLKIQAPILWSCISLVPDKNKSFYPESENRHFYGLDELAPTIEKACEVRVTNMKKFLQSLNIHPRYFYPSVETDIEESSFTLESVNTTHPFVLRKHGWRTYKYKLEENGDQYMECVNNYGLIKFEKGFFYQHELLLDWSVLLIKEYRENLQIGYNIDKVDALFTRSYLKD